MCMNHYVDTQEIATSVGMVEQQDKEVLLMGIYVEISAADDVLVRYQYDAQIVEFFYFESRDRNYGQDWDFLIYELTCVYYYNEDQFIISR